MKVNVEFILIALSRAREVPQFRIFPTRMKRSILAAEDIDIQFCGFVGLTFHKDSG